VSAWKRRTGPGRSRASKADHTTRQLLAITGLIAFYDEKVDTFVDGRRLDRPVMHFS
jgi:hypothetical protein